jgi:hypothetical protein
MLDPQTLVSKLSSTELLPFVMLYIGPESILPLTSAIAAIFGFLLIFWQRFVALVQKLWRLIVRKQVDV